MILTLLLLGGDAIRIVSIEAIIMYFPKAGAGAGAGQSG